MPFPTLAFEPAIAPPPCGDLIAHGLTADARLVTGTTPYRPLTCWAHQPAGIPGSDNPAERTSQDGTPRGRMLALLHRAQSRAASSPFGTDLLLLFADWAEEAARSFADPHHAIAQDWMAVAALARDGAAELRPALPGGAS